MSQSTRGENDAVPLPKRKRLSGRRVHDNPPAALDQVAGLLTPSWRPKGRDASAAKRFGSH
jgi:hypothetical protein